MVRIKPKGLGLIGQKTPLVETALPRRGRDQWCLLPLGYRSLLGLAWWVETLAIWAVGLVVAGEARIPRLRAAPPSLSVCVPHP